MRECASNKPKAAKGTMDRSARDRLILEHLPQVEHVAKRIYAKLPASVEFCDMVSVGILGLIDALEKFDLARGIKLKTFAEYRIRGAMLDSLRQLDWTPRALRRQSRTMETTCQSLEQSLGRRATDEEKCKTLGFSFEKFHRLEGTMTRMNVRSLEETAGDCDDQERASPLRCLAGPLQGSPTSTLQKAEVCGILDKAIDALPGKERLVISLYYYDELTMLDIGHILGVNESRISQIHGHAIHRLRARLKALSLAA